MATHTTTPTNGLTLAREATATWFLPSENEWYKAAYYNPTTTSYFTYATSSNTTPTVADATPTGDVNLVGFRVATVAVAAVPKASALAFGALATLAALVVRRFRPSAGGRHLGGERPVSSIRPNLGPAPRG